MQDIKCYKHEYPVVGNIDNFKDNIMIMLKINIVYNFLPVEETFIKENFIEVINYYLLSMSLLTLFCTYI